ncbi:MAG: hypothetical protein WBA28_03765, partial [Microbacteriaceae bacterium]
MSEESLSEDTLPAKRRQKYPSPAETHEIEVDETQLSNSATVLGKRAKKAKRIAPIDVQSPALSPQVPEAVQKHPEQSEAPTVEIHAPEGIATAPTARRLAAGLASDPASASVTELSRPWPVLEPGEKLLRDIPLGADFEALRERRLHTLRRRAWLLLSALGISVLGMLSFYIWYGGQ